MSRTESFPFSSYHKEIMLQLSLEELDLLTARDNRTCIFVKTINEGYVFANQNFVRLYLGVSDLSKLVHKVDKELTEDMKLVSIYRELDNCVLETEKTLIVNEIVKPKKHKNLVKHMQGKLIPLFSQEDKPSMVLGVVTPEDKILSLEPQMLWSLSIEKLQELLINRSYKVQVGNNSISLSRQELLCFVGVLRGKHAGEIAQNLGLKQLTVESYIQNLKNKCGVVKKSDLVDFFVANNILEQIVI